MGTSQYNMADFETSSEKILEQEILRCEIIDVKGNPHTIYGSVKVNYQKQNGSLILKPLPLEVIKAPNLGLAIQNMAQKAKTVISDALKDALDERDHANGQTTIHDMIQEQ